MNLFCFDRINPIVIRPWIRYLFTSNTCTLNSIRLSHITAADRGGTPNDCSQIKEKTKLNAHTHDTRRFHWQYQKKTICSGTCCYLLHLLAIQCIICITTYNAWSIYKRVFVVSMLYALWTRCNTTARSNDRNNDESISVSQVWPPIHNWFWRNSKVSSLK